MFDFERATDYIRSLELPGSTLSEEIQKDALAGDVPIIRPETLFLKLGQQWAIRRFA